MKPVYLDASATTPMDPRVRAAMEPFFAQEYANPSSLHDAGQRAHDAIESGRLAIARWLNCRPDELVFTSCGTESINLALQGVVKASRATSKHIITTAIEHHAVLQTCAHLEQHENVSVTRLPVDKNGRVDPAAVEKAIRPDTLLISVMHVNNEVGAIQPIAEIGAIARKHKVLFHTDACQAGMLDLDVKRLNVDLVTLNASKLEGPKGAGLLYIKSGTKLVPLLHGGGQERGLRSGTENVPAVVGFAKALEIIQSERAAEQRRSRALRDRLESGLKRLGATIVAEAAERAPSISSATFPGVEAESLLLRLSERGVYVSTGSACAMKTLEPSHVLLAMGLNSMQAHGTLRFSLCRQTAETDIDAALDALAACLADMRALPARVVR